MKHIDNISFRQDMRELRSKKYGELIKGIRKKLGFGDNVSNASMEALFIMSTEDCFLDELDKAKSVLVALGLVRGYSRHGVHALAGKKNPVGKRREQFFNEIGETEISLGTQRQNDGRWINEVADYLCKLYIEEGIENYLKKAEAKYKSSVADYIPDNELPALSDIGKRPVVQDGLIEESLSVDAEQGANDDPINSADEIDERGPETLTDDEPKLLIIPDFLLREKLPEKQPRQYPPLSPEEVDQFIEDSKDAFLNDSEDDDYLTGAALLAAIREEKKKRWFMAFRICLLLFGCVSLVTPLFSSTVQYKEIGKYLYYVPIIILFAVALQLEKKGKTLFMALTTCLLFLVCFSSAILLLGSTAQNKEIREIIGKYLYYGLIIMFLMVLSLGLVCFFLKRPWTLPERKKNFKTRRGYTVQQIKDGVLGKRIVFNSILDGPVDSGFKGNEKKFMSVKKVGDESGEWQYGNINVENRSEYLIRIFVHNDNPNGYDAIAKRCRVKIRIPDISSKTAQVCGAIFSDNAKPWEYWDSVTFCNATTPFRLTYLKPAVLCNNGVGQEGYQLSKKIIDSEGAFIGYDYCDGEIPGGDGYESNILLKVMVELDTDFTVKFKGNDSYMSGGWWDIVEVNIWDTINFQIGYKNSSNAIEPQKNVTVSIDLPECLSYVPGRTSLNTIPQPFSDDKLYDNEFLFFHDGFNIGDFNPGASATITFGADVVDRGLSSGCNEVLATVKISAGEVTNYDTVKIIINKE